MESLSSSLAAVLTEEPTRDPVELLPRDMVWRVFSFVPVDQRLVLNLVSRGWHTAAADPCVWQELDFSCYACPVPLSLIRVALRCARGQLRVLDVSKTRLPFKAILDILRGNPSLRVLRLSEDESLPIFNVDALLGAAPRLVTLQCFVKGEPQAMLPLLRKEAPRYGALRLFHAYVERVSEEDEADVPPLAVAASAHEGLQALTLDNVPLSVTQLTKVVDAAVQRKLTFMAFLLCSLTPAHLPQLTRLLKESPLRDLCILSSMQPLLIGDAVRAFCAALRASRVVGMTLAGASLFHSLPCGLALLDALTGHRHLIQLMLPMNRSATADRRAVGAALGRLLAVQSPLESLDVRTCSLGDAGVTPLFEALAHGATIQSLRVNGSGISRACARDVVLPAVRANASLKRLEVDQPDVPELAQAEQHVGGEGEREPPFQFE